MANKQEQQEELYESFESFWSDHTQNRVVPTVDILGVDVPVPYDVSLGLQQRVFTAEGNDMEGMAELLEEMFGEEILEGLFEAGVTGDQMVIILAWGVMNGSGQKVSFREAARTFYSAEEGDADPPALRKAKQAKQAASNGQKKSTSSRRTGSTSSGTSGGTTASRRKTSQK